MTAYDATHVVDVGCPHRIPTVRPNPFDPPTALRGLPAISPLTFASGRTGWLITSHKLAREVLRNPLFITDRKQTEMPIRELPAVLREYGTPPGMFNCLDGESHARYRRLLASYFSAGRIAQLEPMITEVVEEQLEVVAAAFATRRESELLTDFGIPVALRVMSNLLGIPASIQPDVLRLAEVLFDLTASGDAMLTTIIELRSLLLAAIQAPDVRGSGGLVSELVSDTSLDDEERFQICQVLLLAGFETTANMLTLGVFALIAHRDQLDTLKRGDTDIARVIDELLRYLAITHMGPVRAAGADVNLAGTLVRAGESVMISVPLINRDPELLADGDELQVGRDPVNHLAFGSGAHKCIGQHLARTELEIATESLFARFPDLVLAIRPEDVPMRTDMLVYGVHELPLKLAPSAVHPGPSDGARASDKRRAHGD